MIEQALLDRHIGREQRSEDIADPERMLRLSALLDRPWTPADGIPPLGHFLLFRPDDIQSRIGEDGHAIRDPDGMFPAVPLPRRMWAGSRVRFVGAMQSGQRLIRTSRLASAVPKSGKSGQMLFCTVEHEICAADNGELLIAEAQDIVYREAHPGPGLAPRPVIVPEKVPQFTSTRRPGSVELFRYSALTFNGHRIHYDRDYARDAEGYPGLVVHGPLLATLLFDHLQQVAPGRRIVEFSFRAMSPSFDGEELSFGASINGDRADLLVVNPAGVAMTGSAVLALG